MLCYTIIIRAVISIVCISPTRVSALYCMHVDCVCVCGPDTTSSRGGEGQAKKEDNIWNYLLGFCSSRFVCVWSCFNVCCKISHNFDCIVYFFKCLVASFVGEGVFLSCFNICCKILSDCIVYFSNVHLLSWIGRACLCLVKRVRIVPHGRMFISWRYNYACRCGRRRWFEPRTL